MAAIVSIVLLRDLGQVPFLFPASDLKDFPPQDVHRCVLGPRAAAAVCVYLPLHCCHLVPPPALVQRGYLDPGVQMGAKHPHVTTVDVAS
jgi:hypothetical protein